MLELRAGGGFGGAARQFYDRHRLVVVSVVLSLVGVITGTMTAMALLQKFAVVDVAVVAAGAVLAFCLCVIQFRHLPLAVATALVPLPGLLWAAPVSGGSEFGAVPLLAYGFGFAFATLVSQTRVEHVIGEIEHEPPFRSAVVSLGLMAALALLWFRGTASADAALQAVSDAALSVLSSALLLPLTMTWLHFDETFVARANRERERRSRFFEWVAQITIPRWAFSFSGITIVFLALGWYGAELVIRDGVLQRTAAVFAAVIVGAVVAGGWRKGLAIGLVGSAIALLALWATVVDSRTPFSSVGILQVASLALFFGLYSGRQALSWRRNNEPPVIAERRTLEEASAEVFAGLGAAAAVAPALALWPGSAVFVFTSLMAAWASISLVPAVSTALEVLMPRRRSVEEIYGRRKRPLAR